MGKKLTSVLSAVNKIHPRLVLVVRYRTVCACDVYTIGARTSVCTDGQTEEIEGRRGNATITDGVS